MSALADIIAIALFMVDEVLEKFFAVSYAPANFDANLCGGYATVAPTACGTMLIDNIAVAVSSVLQLVGQVLPALGTLS